MAGLNRISSHMQRVQLWRRWFPSSWVPFSLYLHFLISFCARLKLSLFSCLPIVRQYSSFPIRLGLKDRPRYRIYGSLITWRHEGHQGQLLFSWYHKVRELLRILLAFQELKLLLAICVEAFLWQFSRRFWMVLCSGQKFCGDWWAIFFSRTQKIWLYFWRVIRWYWCLQL